MRSLAAAVATRRLVARCWVAFCLVAPLESASAADPEASARAEQLFQEGLERMSADDCQEAILRFLESQRLDPSAATLTNTATCQDRLGQTASAWHTYRQAADLAELEGDTELDAKTRAALAKLGPGLTRLWILTAGAAEALTITVNGEVVDRRTPIPVNPGEVTVEATAPGRVSWRTTVRATDPGATIDVIVPDLEVVPPTPGPVEDSAGDRPPKPHADLRPAAFAVAGVGVVGLVVGAVYAVNAKDAYDDAAPYCPDRERCTDDGVELWDKARSRATVASWTAGLGALAIATGATLWILSPSRADQGRIRLAPWIAQPQNARTTGVWGLQLVGEL
ncbi:MAG: hypothetical protein JW751_22790 [Polyangiaceae bacterium]|nr:hypothetical protein [Polyangiaceae bacterium]